MRLAAAGFDTATMPAAKSKHSQWQNDSDRQHPQHRGIGPQRRRRHSGRPEDLRRSRHLRHGGDHRADRAEHPGRARLHRHRPGIRRRADRRGVRRRARRRGEDRHGGHRADRPRHRRGTAPAPGAKRRAGPGDGRHQRRPPAAGRCRRRAARRTGAARTRHHAEHAGSRGADRRLRSRTRWMRCAACCPPCIASARTGCC